MLNAKSVTKLFSWPLDACSSIVIFFIFLLCLAKHTEAGVLYFNNLGNRPAGYTSQVLDPRSIDGP